MREKFATVGMALGCAFLFTVCDSLCAAWAKRGARSALTAALVLGPFSYLAFAYVNTRLPLAVVSGWVNVTMAVMTMLVGLLVFGERDVLTSRQWVGCALAVVSLVLLLGPGPDTPSREIPAAEGVATPEVVNPSDNGPA
jgi:drug/metabolite transporter (DMT)-like permease